MTVAPYQKIIAVAMSMFYAILIMIGLFQLPALLINYFPQYLGEALGGFCLLMILLYFMTLLAIFWD